MIFGLFAATGWGLADYFAALAGRRMGSVATVIVGQSLCAIFMTVVLVATGTSIGVLSGLLGPLALNGVFTATAYATHYRALELGPVAVVSPIGASFAVIGIALAMVFLDERPTAVQLAGAGVTIVGVALVSTDLRALRAGIREHPPGLWWAIVSAVGFGVAAFLLGYVSREAGWVAGLWGSTDRPDGVPRPARRGVATRPRAPRNGRSGRDRSGAGQPARPTSSASRPSRPARNTASSRSCSPPAPIFPLIAVVLSTLFLHERLVMNQYAGIAAGRGRAPAAGPRLRPTSSR